MSLTSLDEKKEKKIAQGLCKTIEVGMEKNKKRSCPQRARTSKIARVQNDNPKKNHGKSNWIKPKFHRARPSEGIFCQPE